MRQRNTWGLVLVCCAMLSTALYFALRRPEQPYAYRSSPRDPAPESWFSPRQRPVADYNIAREMDNALANAVARVMPSVVVIRTERIQYEVRRDTLGFFYRIPEQLLGEGSGVIVDERGYVMTSWHVIEGADQNAIEVVLNDGTKMTAKAVGYDTATDLAVLKILNADGMAFPSVEFGDSDAIRVGETVIAIGSPFSLQGSVTKGIVSQKGRRMQVLPYEDFIQTDVAINEGNSGGPLIDVDGRLIGINAAILTEAQERGVGIAFAVPSNLSMVIAKSLIENGKHVWPWVGASFGSVKQDGASKLRVTRIWRDTPAAREGLLIGDRILEVNERPMNDEYDVHRVVFNHSVGDRLRFRVERNLEELEIVLPLEEFPGLPF